MNFDQTCLAISTCGLVIFAVLALLMAGKMIIAGIVYAITGKTSPVEKLEGFDKDHPLATVRLFALAGLLILGGMGAVLIRSLFQWVGS